MSYLLNSSSSIFAGVLSHANNYGLSCQFRNLSTVALRNYNILIVDNDLDRKLFDTLTLNKQPSSTATTATSTTSSATTAAAKSEIRDDYDYEGALIYIIFILCFYSLSVILMIIIQTQKSQFYHLDKSNGFGGASASNVLRRIRSENIEREALEDLKDVAWRQKLWSIYTSNPNNYKIRRFESKRVAQIDRRLRQYYGVAKPDVNKPGGAATAFAAAEAHYRTFDPGQLEQHGSNYRDSINSGRHAAPLLLLKDINKFDYHHSNSVPNHSHSPAQPPPPSSYHLHPNSNNTNTSTNQQQQQQPARKMSRFTIEKIKTDLV